MALSFFEEIEPTEKLVEILRHANDSIVLAEMEDFLKHVAELELKEQGAACDSDVLKHKADDIAMRLMGAILSKNE